MFLHLRFVTVQGSHILLPKDNLNGDYGFVACQIYEFYGLQVLFGLAGGVADVNVQAETAGD